METTTYNLIQALGWSILHSIWLGAICYILVNIIKLINPKQSAAARYNTAFFLQVSIFLGFMISFLFYYSKYKAMQNLYQATPPEMIPAINFQEGSPFSLERLFPYLVAAYLIGFIIQVLILCNSYLKLRQLKYTGLDSIPKEWNQLFNKSKESLQINKRVSIFLSKHISVPLTVGFLKPFVLFPIAFVNNLNTTQVEAIILHELAHIKRQDYLFNLLKVVMETLLFFNPFVWALSKMIEKERENACDDMVLKQISTPIHYAKALVELEELRMKNTPALSMAATGNKNHLFQRIKRITNMETNHRNVKQQLLAVLASSVAMISLAMLIPAQQSVAEEIELIDPIVPAPHAALKPMSAEVCLDTIKPVNTVNKIKVNNHEIVDTTELPAHVRKAIKEMELNSKDVAKMTNSPEWKKQMQSITEQTAKVNEVFKSDDWKNKMASINISNEKIKEVMKDKKWADMSSNEINKFFNSKEWKDQIKSIEDHSKQVASYFESDDWKDQMKSIEAETKNIQKYFESPEWKNKMQKIEQGGKEIEKYFQSEEWKQKVKEKEELYNSEEYKELQKKYEEDLNRLKRDRKSKAI